MKQIQFNDKRVTYDGAFNGVRVFRDGIDFSTTIFGWTQEEMHSFNKEYGILPWYSKVPNSDYHDHTPSSHIEEDGSEYILLRIPETKIYITGKQTK